MWGYVLKKFNERIESMIKVGISDCVKQIIAINKQLDEHDSRQDAHIMFIKKLQDRIERLEQQTKKKE